MVCGNWVGIFYGFLVFWGGWGDLSGTEALFLGHDFIYALSVSRDSADIGRESRWIAFAPPPTPHALISFLPRAGRRARRTSRSCRPPRPASWSANARARGALPERIAAWSTPAHRWARRGWMDGEESGALDWRFRASLLPLVPRRTRTFPARPRGRRSSLA